MHTPRPKLHLIDGSGYIFRAYYAVRTLSTSDGTPTNAVLGFAKMLHKLLRQEQPEHIAIAFDTAEDNFRHQMYPKYKANRSDPPEDLTPQFPLIYELVEAMGLPSMAIVGYEADDVLATQARCAVAAGYDVVLVTGDKDLMQLVGDHLTLFDPMKDQFFTRNEVIDRFGVPPEHIVDFLALMGDSSDNVPGVPKVGPVAAAKLIHAYGDVEAVIAGLSTQKKHKVYEASVLENADLARLSKRLVILQDHVPMPFDAAKLRWGGPREPELAAFLTRIEARGLLRDFGLEAVADPSAPHAAALRPAYGDASAAIGEGSREALAAASGAPASEVAGRGLQHLAHAPPGTGPGQANPSASTGPQRRASAPAEMQVDAAPGTPQNNDQLLALFGTLSPTRPIDRAAYRTLFHHDDLVAVADSIRRAKVVSVDLETTSLNAMQADIVGVSVCVPDGVPAYVPVAHHYLGVPRQLPLEDVLAVLAPLLSDPGIGKVGQHLKYDALVLRRVGVHLTPIAHDSMLAAYALDPSRPSYGLDALAREYLGHECIAYDDVTGKGRNRRPFSDVTVEEATAYAAEDADVALRLCQLLVRSLHAARREAVYRDIEMPLVPVLIEMEAAGVAIDAAHFAILDKEFAERLLALEAQAHAMLGRRMNLASPKQLAEVFFTELKLSPGRKTKTGFSTDQAVLESLAPQHPLAAIVLQHRLLSKLKGTYIDALPRLCDSVTRRVHTSFQQTGTATGRLSSTDPNLQNIPIRGEDGRRIRAGIVAPAGHVILCADYSQIELRIMAHLANDESFIDAFSRGEDIHARTASEILTGGEPVSKEARRRAKAINFGILYGLSEFGLARQLSIPRAEAQAYIRAYFARYSRIRSFLDGVIEEGRQRGYTQTLFGRRRPLPNLASSNGTLRQGAERIAMNAPIQGSAADLIKVAMVRVQRELSRSQWATRLLLQVHDELVLEVPTHEVAAVRTLVITHMAQAARLRVPLVVDVGTGANWAEAH